MRAFRITQRQSVLGVLVLLVVVSLAMTVVLFALGTAQYSPLLPWYAMGGSLLNAGLLAAYWRGYEIARPITVLLFTALVIGATPIEPQRVASSLYLPAGLALLLLTPRWVLACAVVTLAGLAARAGAGSAYVEATLLVNYALLIGCMIFARLVADTARHDAESLAVEAQASSARAEQRALQLDEATRHLEAEVARQSELLALVETLETPVVRLAEGTLYAPVVGHLDTRRADALMQRLLGAVHTQRARALIIDIAGVAIIDTSVAQALSRTVQALRLLGCEVIISGVSAAVASSLAQLGATLGAVPTVRSPEEALATLAG